LIDRVKTGIPGVDEIVAGGIPRSASVVIAGGPGCGKTILAMQYIYNGASALAEPGIFITIQTDVQNIVWDMQNFRWNFKALQDRNLVRIERVHFDSKGDVHAQVEEQLQMIKDMVLEMKAKRLVIDSITGLGLWIEGKSELRNTLFEFLSDLKAMGCTTLLTAETGGEKTEFGSFNVEQFVADGIVALYFVPPNRGLFVRKMRGTNHSKKVHPMEITEQGMVVKAKDEILWQSLR
jgi:KaiC/GvpD/RAD55 family RecA-like ATPase